jgi:nitrile hydratase accessory protein
LSAREEALASAPSIPRDPDGPVFPAPWAARAFAMAVALNERGVFAWPDWSHALGAELARQSPSDASDPEAYWRAWLATLESLLAKKSVARATELSELQEAWRDAAEHTPHGEPIELPGRHA